MAQRRVEWGTGEVREVHSAEELESLLDRLTKEASGQPFLVELFASSGAALSVGLGHEISVANFTSPEGQPPYFQSGHEPSSDDDNDEPLVFFYGGDWSDFPASSGISVADAREALR
jgi:hypothetical protein